MLRIIKRANIVFENYLFSVILYWRRFPFENLTLNVGCYFHIDISRCSDDK